MVYHLRRVSPLSDNAVHIYQLHHDAHSNTELDWLIKIMVAAS